MIFYMHSERVIKASIGLSMTQLRRLTKPFAEALKALKLLKNKGKNKKRPGRPQHYKEINICSN